MEPIDLTGKSFCIFGLPDSGKSTLACYILQKYGGQAFIYDTLREYPETPFDSYEPKDTYSVAELERVTRRVMASGRYKLLVIDEANRFCPPKPSPLPSAMADLNDFRAHYDMGAGFICRRPVQLNQDLTELAHYLFIFKLTGRNDIDYLNSISRGLGDPVARLRPYHFMVVYPDRDYRQSKPAPRQYVTSKKRRPPSPLTKE